MSEGVTKPRRDVVGHRAAGPVKSVRTKENVEPRTLFRSISSCGGYPRMEREPARANGDANGSSILEIFEFLAAT